MDRPDVVLDFTTMPRAMFTLFTVAMVADWTDIVSPVMIKHWWPGCIFFVSFAFCATFGTLNLIIGVITERTAEVQNGYRAMEALRIDCVKMENISALADTLFKDAGEMGQTEY